MFELQQGAAKVRCSSNQKLRTVSRLQVRPIFLNKTTRQRGPTATPIDLYWLPIERWSSMACMSFQTHKMLFGTCYGLHFCWIGQARIIDWRSLNMRFGQEADRFRPIFSQASGTARLWTEAGIPTYIHTTC
jgi:hypothetical protein